MQDSRNQRMEKMTIGTSNGGTSNAGFQQPKLTMMAQGAKKGVTSEAGFHQQVSQTKSTRHIKENYVKGRFPAINANKTRKKDSHRRIPVTNSYKQKHCN